VETTDGRTAAFVLNDQRYELTQGTLFLIKITGGSAQISQQQSLLSDPCFDDQTCQPLLKQHPAVLQFIQESLQARGRA
jgi:hypothetical protein